MGWFIENGLYHGDCGQGKYRVAWIRLVALSGENLRWGQHGEEKTDFLPWKSATLNAPRNKCGVSVRHSLPSLYRVCEVISLPK